MITISAPGKVHLLGEHAVVYGEPAIISAIGLRTNVKFEKSDEVRYVDRRFDADNSWPVIDVLQTARKTADLWQTCAEEKNFAKLFEVVKANEFDVSKQTYIGLVLDKLGIHDGVTVDINSEIPVGSGLASSASLSVALVKGIADLYGRKLSLFDVNDLAYELEKIMHGTPSGGDNSTCCFGGLVWFKKAQPKNEIISLKKEIPYKLENFVIVYTRQPKKTTGELVQLVRDLDENYRNERIQKIGRLVNEMKYVLQQKDFEHMKDIINEDQMLLAELGVSTDTIDEIAYQIRCIGGAAKLSGAGGGGAMLCYHDDKKKLIKAIKDMGYKFWDVELGVEGVRTER
jgi:mevalonate kinase